MYWEQPDVVSTVRGKRVETFQTYMTSVYNCTQAGRTLLLSKIIKLRETYIITYFVYPCFEKSFNTFRQSVVSMTLV